VWLLISYAAIRRVAVPVDPRAETPDPFRFKLSTGGAARQRWALARGACGTDVKMLRKTPVALLGPAAALP
jgi:hypothetical protein